MEVTSISRSTDTKRVRKRKNHSGSQSTQAKAFSFQSTGLDFLKTTLHPYPKEHFRKEFNLENYNYLYESAKNYSKLLGSSFELEPDPKGKDFVTLYNYFESLLPKDQRLEVFKTRENKLLFDVYFNPDYIADDTVYYIPVEIINNTEGELNTIVLTFFQLFQCSQQLEQFDELWDMQTTITDYPYDDGDLENKDLDLYIREFDKDGYIYKIFKNGCGGDIVII